MARRQLWSQAFEGIDLADKTVLDAGTGEGHFTRFLAERRPGRLVSITCLEQEIEPAKEVVGEYGDLEFQVADLTNLSTIASESFDVVGADYLIAAVSAYRPYREVDCLKELVRVLKPGGRIIVCGWEVWPTPRNETERRIRRLGHLRDAVSALWGRIPFREHPAFWVENRLAELGMPAERTVRIPDVHRDFRWLTANIRMGLDELEPGPLRDALSAKLAEQEAEVVADPSISEGFEFGALYAVVACKLSGGVLLIP
jgi:SAM-dependent methyltransferase